MCAAVFVILGTGGKKEGVTEAQNGSCSPNNLLIVDRWSLKVTH